jgi:hypothetical protein
VGVAESRAPPDPLEPLNRIRRQGVRFVKKRKKSGAKSGQKVTQNDLFLGHFGSLFDHFFTTFLSPILQPRLPKMGCFTFNTLQKRSLNLLKPT